VSGLLLAPAPRLCSVQPPPVTRHHRKEGADARQDRSTYSATVPPAYPSGVLMAEAAGRCRVGAHSASGTQQGPGCWMFLLNRPGFSGELVT